MALRKAHKLIMQPGGGVPFAITFASSFSRTKSIPASWPGRRSRQMSSLAVVIHRIRLSWIWLSASGSRHSSVVTRISLYLPQRSASHGSWSLRCFEAGWSRNQLEQRKAARIRRCSQEAICLELCSKRYVAAFYIGAGGFQPSLCVGAMSCRPSACACVCGCSLRPLGPGQP
jgi:hypothetical protein